jgi:hypothetical protein
VFQNNIYSTVTGNNKKRKKETDERDETKATGNILVLQIPGSRQNRTCASPYYLIIYHFQEKRRVKEGKIEKRQAGKGSEA